MSGPDGAIRGVAADLGRCLAAALGVSAELRAYPSSGAIVEDATSGAWDVAFLPADAERKTRLDFGPNYFLGESTLLVAADSRLADIDSVDRPDLKILGIENTATIRSARRVLAQAKVQGVSGLDEAVALFESGAGDALALGREALASLLPRLSRPGRVLPGHFHAAGTALAVPPGRGSAAAVLGGLLEAAKADGTVRGIFDQHGLSEAPVAPAGSRP